MERNDIELIRRWAGEISRDEATMLELKLAGNLEAMNEKIDAMVLKVRGLEDTVKNIRQNVSQDFAEIKEQLTKKPRPQRKKKVEKAVKPSHEIR